MERHEEENQKESKTEKDQYKCSDAKTTVTGIDGNSTATHVTAVRDIYNLYGPISLLIQDSELLKHLVRETRTEDGKLPFEDIVNFLRQYKPISPTLQGNLGLLLACYKGYSSVFTHLLSSVHVTNTRGETHFILACGKHLLRETIDSCQKGDVDYFGCMLAHDLHINKADTSTKNDFSSIVEELLSRDVDINANDNDKFSPLLLSCIFGDLKLVELLLAREVNVNYTGIFGSTALMWACMFGHDKIVSKLLDAGADVNVKADGEFSALFFASFYGREKIVENLISYCADVNERVDDVTPLHYAALFGHLNVARVLISGGAEINTPDDVTPLIYASTAGHSEIAELLISNGADINQGRYNGTPLMFSVMFGHTDITRLLLSHDADIDRRDVIGTTALMAACSGGWDDIVNILLSHGADIHTTDEKGFTTLIHASSCNTFIDTLFGDHNAFKFMICSRTTCSQRLRNIALHKLRQVTNTAEHSWMLGIAHLLCDTSMLSSLQGVFSDQHTDTPAVMPDDWDTHHDRVLEKLLSRGVDVNSTNNAGDSALHVACKAGYESRVRIMLEHGADVSISDNDSDTPLSVVSREGHSDIVKLLLNQKAVDNVRGSRGDTPLIEASREGHVNVVETLLTDGADVNIINDQEETALTVAEEGDHDKVVILLLKAIAMTR